jgi:hypothetical protein
VRNRGDSASGRLVCVLGSPLLRKAWRVGRGSVAGHHSRARTFAVYIVCAWSIKRLRVTDREGDAVDGALGEHGGHPTVCVRASVGTKSQWLCTLVHFLGTRVTPSLHGSTRCAPRISRTARMHHRRPSMCNQQVSVTLVKSQFVVGSACSLSKRSALVSSAHSARSFSPATRRAYTNPSVILTTDL